MNSHAIVCGVTANLERYGFRVVLQEKKDKN